jgi:hypothetical protein
MRFDLDEEFDDNDSDFFTKLVRQNERSGPCEDDFESTTRFMDLVPEESSHEYGSPIDIRHGKGIL